LKKDLAEAMKNGVLAGYPIDKMKVRLFDGSFHAVDSDSLSFEISCKISI
jgi:elongation factor G